MKKNTIISLASSLLCLLLSSCGGLESIHEQYLNGEQIYAGKLDSLHVRSGFKRLMITGNTRYLGNSREAIVEFEGKQLAFEITDPKAKYFSMVIDSLEEKTYEFTVYTLDNRNNKSVIQTVSGKSMGDNFIQNQKNRRISGIEVKPAGTFVNWAHKAENQYAEVTRFYYETTSGAMMDEICSDSTIMKIDPEWIPETVAKIESGIITGEKGIDTITLAQSFMTLPERPLMKLDKKGFKLMHLPDDNRGNAYGADPDKYLFDDDGRWTGNDVFGFHSGENAIPHHFTVDLGVKAEVLRIRLDMRDPANFAGNNPTKIELWGINELTGAETSKSDPDEFRAKGWTQICEHPVNGEESQFAELEIPAGEKYRYIRYRVTQTVRNQAAQLVELTFWARNVEYIN